MAKKIDEQVKKRLKEGWIRCMMFMEVMAVSKKATESALAKHMEKLRKEKGVLVHKEDMKGAKKIEKPFPNIPEAYSQITEFEILTENYDKLVYVVLNYGPSGIEILEPNNIKMDLGEAQGILNALAALVHRFAAAGAGGIMVNV